MAFMERLNTLCKEKGISKRTLEKEAGLGTGSTSKWKDKNPNQVSLQKLSDYFNVSVSYLIGESEFRTEHDVMLNRWMEEHDCESLADDAKKYERGVKIPVIGDVAAGIPIEAIEEILDWEEIPESWARLGEHFALRIKGDSMSPRILAGDVVIVRQQEDADSGDTVIAKVNGFEATCKKLIKHEDGISLVSINSEYEPMYYSNKEILSKPVQIIGKVIELRGKF